MTSVYASPLLGHVLFFYVSRHFFFTKPTRACGKKAKCPTKKEHWLSVPDYLTNKIVTYQTYCVERSHSFVYFLPHNDLGKQLPVGTKVGLFLVLDLSSQAKNVLESSTETLINIANVFVLTRSLVRWEAWPSFRFQTKTHILMFLSKQDLITISRVYVRLFQQKGSWLLVFSD